jgi:PleD family two-component response regulator
MPHTTDSVAAVAQVPQPHVLLVEDQERAARGLQELLALEGFRVTCAADGPSGLDLAKASQVDAIVLDVLLPGMDGFDVCRALRRHASTSNVPVVMLTGLDDTPSKLHGFDTGADDYLVKPVPARELAARLRKLIARRLNASTEVHQQRVQAIGEIAAAVGHEINNPLAAALGTLDLLQLRSDLSPDARRDLAACRAHLWRIASTLSQLTNVRDRTVAYLGPDRMIDLKPEGHA